MQLAALAWNLFHGRDFPPNPALFTWRSRLLRVTERDQTHVQVNRDLRAEFAATLAGWSWDVALLQECPPRFEGAIGTAAGAETHRALTSRNGLGRLRAAAARLNPDLVASAEGGSNLTAVRRAGPLGKIVEREEVAIHAGRPERRAMALTRTASGVCVANLHATNDAPELATADVMLAAREAVAFAGPEPLLFGGDLNLRPGQNPDAFAWLESEHGLAGPTSAGAIDHLLARGLEAIEPSRALEAGRRELTEDGRALRLSDHAPIQARFEAGA